MSTVTTLSDGQILTGLFFNELMRAETVLQNKDGTWSLGLVGFQTEWFRKVALSTKDLQSLTVLDSWFGSISPSIGAIPTESESTKHDSTSLTTPSFDDCVPSILHDLRKPKSYKVMNPLGEGGLTPTEHIP